MHLFDSCKCQKKKKKWEFFFFYVYIAIYFILSMRTQNELCVQHGCNKNSNIHSLLFFSFLNFFCCFFFLSPSLSLSSIFFFDSLYVPSGVVSGTNSFSFHFFLQLLFLSILLLVYYHCISILYGCFISIVRQSSSKSKRQNLVEDVQIKKVEQE